MSFPVPRGSGVTGFRPSMRRWLNARDRTCRNPICQRPAWLCDQDHTLAYHKGGQTCSCNLGPTRVR